MTLRTPLSGLGAFRHECVDRGLRHLPASADLQRAQLPGADQVPGGRVVDAQQRCYLAQVEEKR